MRYSVIVALLSIITVTGLACGNSQPTAIPPSAPTATSTTAPSPTARIVQLPTLTPEPPPTIPAAVQISSATPTPAPAQVSTVTPLPLPTATATPAPSPTPAPTFTPRPTFTPTPTRAPTPTPLPLSKLLYADDFEDNKSGLGTRIRDRYERGYVQGEYRIMVKQQDWYITASIPRNYSDFDVKIRARTAVSEDDKWYGLVFRREDSANSYVFIVNPTIGRYMLRMQKDNRWSTLIRSTSSPFISRGDAVNEIRVIARGSLFELYINGELVDSVRDLSFKSGRIALIANNISDPAGAEVFFDGLRVYGAESEVVPTATPAPTPIPALVSIPLPPGTIGLLYRDDFGDPDSGWRVLVRDTQEQGYANGEYRMLEKELASGVWAQAIPTFTDFDVRVQARNGRAQAGNYGLLFRFQDRDNYYVFWVNPSSGNYRVLKQVRGEYTTLRGWGNSPLIPRGNDPMDLRVVARGNMLNFYVNDKLLDGFTDGSLKSGRVGLWIVNDVASDGAEVFFDNLRVFAIR